MPPAGKHSDLDLVIAVSGLSKRFNREWIFRNLDYTFEPANIYALTGPNGSGKSTLLQILWGQLPPSKGELKYTKKSNEIPPDEIFNHLAVATPLFGSYRRIYIGGTPSFSFQAQVEQESND